MRHSQTAHSCCSTLVRKDENIPRPHRINQTAPPCFPSLSTSAATFCIHCGSEIAEGEEGATACRLCDSMRRVKSEICGSKETPRCPECDSGDVRPILYGAPSEAMWELCANRHAIWGGCLVDGHEPQWACGSCHRNWGEPREASSYYCILCGRPSSQIWCSECCARNEEESARLFSEAFREFERQEAEREVVGAALLGLLLILESSSWAPSR